MIAGRRQGWKQKQWGQYDMEVPFTKMITDDTGNLPVEKRYDYVPVGYSG
jgi:hypothetical protein